LEVNNINEIAKATILNEAESVKKLADYIDDSFADVIEMILKSKGRVIVTGIGKSANIANKIVATFNSTGTPSIFMHAADAIHGDLGIIQNDDVVVCISKSGNTPEIKVLIPLIKNMGNKIIALVSNVDSFLAKQADYILRATVDGEACPNNLAPTNSTTAQLVLGDAMAVCLLHMRGFTSNDFAQKHPGGALGKKLYMHVSDLYINNETPKNKPEDSVSDVIVEISRKRLGATAVVDDNNILLGIITDGDLRRMLQETPNFNNLLAKDIMTVKPKTCKANELAINAFHTMENNSITQIVVLDNDKYLGFVHIHDIIREGIV